MTATLQSFGITDFGPGALDNLEIAAVMARCVAEHERKQVRVKAAAAAEAENQSTRTEITETSGTKGDSTEARGSNSAPVEAQDTKIAVAADETAKKEDGRQALDSIGVSNVQQSHEDSERGQVIKEELDELLRPLRQSLGEVLDP